jgi:hypothetical protein
MAGRWCAQWTETIALLVQLVVYTLGDNLRTGICAILDRRIHIAHDVAVLAAKVIHDKHEND